MAQAFKIFISFCCQALLICSAFGRIHTGKTFLLPQPIRVASQNVFYNYSQDLFAKNKRLSGGSIQMTSFRRIDQNKDDIGKYFGRNEKNVISIGTGVTDFQASNLIFTSNPTLKGTLELRPYRRIRGIYLDYLQRLNFLSTRFFFGISCPFIHVNRFMQVKVCNETRQVVDSRVHGIMSYFCGYLSQRDKQEPLKFAKINSGLSQSKSDIGDIEATISYQSNKNNKYYVRSFFGAIAPSSNKAKGEYLFEIITGNGKHWGVISGAEAMAILYKSGPTKISVTYGAKLKYCFSNTQKRTISFRSDDIDSMRSWAHYYGFLGESGKIGVFPGANVLTRDVKVRPGLIFDFFANYNLFHENWLCSFGYNFFSRSQEAVKNPCWENGKYALASINYDPTTPFVISPTPNIVSSDNIERAISSDMLDTSVAQSPSSIAHKIYGLVSHRWDSVPLCNVSMPVTIGVGGAYEFSQDNAAIEGYELYLRVGASF